MWNIKNKIILNPNRKKRIISREPIDLPEALFIEILSRLPVRCLMQFRCVCKSWNAIVLSSSFTSVHLNNYTLSNTNSSEYLLVGRSQKITNKPKISLLSVTAAVSLIDLDLPPFITSESFGYPRVYGPCNGIVCLLALSENIAMWNPIIKQFKILPKSRFPRPPEYVPIGIGFGFDSKHNDYKVLQFLFTQSKQQFELYSLSTDSWRKIDADLPPSRDWQGACTLAFPNNTTICWLATDVDVKNDYMHNSISSFDMCDEMFKTISLPPDIDLNLVGSIFPFKESIALILYPHDRRVKEYTFDVWVMTEFSVQESWVKMFSTRPLVGVHQPLGFWKNSEFLIWNYSGDLVLYDIFTHESKHVRCQGEEHSVKTLVYKESFVPIR